MKLQAPSNNGGSSSQEPKADLESSENEQTEQTHELHVPQSSLFEEIDSTCSTPYVSAPSSPGRGSGPVNGGFYYSAPASPMHFALTASYPRDMSSSSPDNSSSSVALGFEFGSGSSANGSMSSADELFLDGKIRPMKLSTHLERPQVLAPLLDLDEQEDDEEDESAGEITSSSRGRDHMRVVLRDKSMRRRTRSLSPLRSTSLKWNEESAFVIDDAKESKSSDSCLCNNKDIGKNEAGCEIHNHNNNNNESSDTAAVAVAAASDSASLSASTSRSSSAGRSTSKRWVFLKDFLYRSKSEGRSTNKFWSTISFSPVHKEKKLPTTTTSSSSSNPICSSSSSKENTTSDITNQRGKVNNGHHHQVKKPVNGIGKRRVPPSPHELHYTANRAQAEEMKKKTFLPYRQGLLGCLGFSSKGYGAMNGFARALNPVSSR